MAHKLFTNRKHLLWRGFIWNCSSCFFRSNKVWSMLHQWVQVQNKLKESCANLIAVLYNFLLPSIVFHKFYCFSSIALPWFLRLYHFYSLFAVYFLYDEVMSVRVYISKFMSLPANVNFLMVLCAFQIIAPMDLDPFNFKELSWTFMEY